LLWAQGEYAKAETFFGDALAMHQALYPEDKYPQRHAHLAASMHQFGALLQAQGKYPQAGSLLQRAVAMYQGLAALYADATSEVQALNYLAQLPVTRDALLSLPHQLHEIPPEAVYASVWHSKAALTRLLERRHQALLGAADPATRALAHELLLTRRQLARLLLAPADPAKDHARRLRDLTDRKEELERQLASALPSSWRPLDRETLAHSELGKRLPDRTAFIDLLRYTRIEQDPKVRGRKGERRTPSYVALLLTKGRAARRVELGPARPIQEALADWRQAIVDWQPSPEGKPRARAERQAAFAAGVVRRLVWEPLAQHLPQDAHTVYLTPDGDLTRLPWAALPGHKDGTILLEELTLAVVPHGPFLLRSLTAPAAKPDPKVDLLLLVGDVSYDQPPTPGAAVKEELVRLRSAARGPEGKLWSSLPGTQAETNMIGRLAGDRRRCDLCGPEAGTARVLAELPQARWAQFATHGFFAAPSFRSILRLDEKQFEYAGTGSRGTAGARNPMVLSGLVLAGSNQPPGKDQDPLTYDHGILTAEVLTALDLRRLDLAVLSACETGLGDVAGGEGVFGLQRAFHLAGTRNVVASLWRVDDRATAALMALFYTKLWQEGKPPLEALQEAQLALYRHPERIPEWAERGFQAGKTAKLPAEAPASGPAGLRGKAPVKLWAGFVLSGAGQR
jgi:CHAT domain-containing protein